MDGNQVRDVATSSSSSKRVFKCDVTIPRTESFRAPPKSRRVDDQWIYDWDKCPRFSSSSTDMTSSHTPPHRTHTVESITQSARELRHQEIRVRGNGKRNILLIRHGQYEYHLDDSRSTLTPLGETQAHLTGARIAALNVRIARILYSTMKRTEQTALIIGEHLHDLNDKRSFRVFFPTDLIREAFPCAPSPPFAYRDHPVVTSSTGSTTANCHHGESKRLENAFKSLFYRPGSRTSRLRRENEKKEEEEKKKDEEEEEDDDKDSKEKDDDNDENSYEIIVGHANIIGYFLCRVLQFPDSAWMRFQLYHCSISWITIDMDGLVRMRQLGDVGHIPPDKLTVESHLS